MYNEEDDQDEFHQRRERRSPLVPIIAIVTSVLAIGFGVIAVLYAMGIIGSRDGQTARSVSEPAVLGEAAAVPPVPSPSLLFSEDTPPIPDAVIALAPQVAGEPPVRSTHADWQIRCDTPAGAQNEQCVLMQFVTAEDRDNVGLTVIVLKTADKQARIMRVLAPLGVLLPSGLGLQIDSSDMGRAGFVRCLPNGCVAEVILEDELLATLRSGSTATFIIFQTPEEGVGIPISLGGFGAGYDSLP